MAGANVLVPSVESSTCKKPPAERGDRNSSAVALQQGYDALPTVPARLPWAATRVA